MWSAANCESEPELLTQDILLQPFSLLKPIKPLHMLFLGLLLLLTIISSLALNVNLFWLIFEQHNFTSFRETELDLQMVYIRVKPMILTLSCQYKPSFSKSRFFPVLAAAMATTSSDLLWQYEQKWELWWRHKNTPFAANKIWSRIILMFSLYKSIFSKLSFHRIFKNPCWLFLSLWYMNSFCFGTFKIGECWCRVLRLINSGFSIYVGSLRQYFISSCNYRKALRGSWVIYTI